MELSVPEYDSSNPEITEAIRTRFQALLDRGGTIFINDDCSIFKRPISLDPSFDVEAGKGPGWTTDATTVGRGDILQVAYFSFEASGRAIHKMAYAVVERCKYNTSLILSPVVLWNTPASEINSSVFPDYAQIVRVDSPEALSFVSNTECWKSPAYIGWTTTDGITPKGDTVGFLSLNDWARYLPASSQFRKVGSVDSKDNDSLVDVMLEQSGRFIKWLNARK